jgi:hypothetical protein
MLSNTYPRLFGQFREGAIIRGAFTFTDSGDTWAAVTAGTGGQHTYNGFSVADAGTGRVTVTFPKCRNVEVLHASIRNPTLGTVGDQRHIELPPMTQTIAQAGSFELNLYTINGGSEAISDPADGAVLGLVLMLDK